MASSRVFTDGACRGNPGPGGWGVLVERGGMREEYCGAVVETTNNRMELQAVIEALQRFPEGESIEIVTDSEYVMKGIQEWLPGWKAKGWRNSRRKPVKNQDLWRTLDALVSTRNIDWRWVRGHTGVEGNECADALANRAIDEMLYS